MGLVRRVFRRSIEQADAYAVDWTAANEVAQGRDGPLWVVLGDSAAQGVGATAHDRGYVGLVLARLVDHDRRPWRVVNLSRSGARTREVVDVQWPLARDLNGDLVTAVIGGNDALHTRRAQWLTDVGDLTAALPPGAVVSTVPRGIRERKVRVVNERLRALAAAHSLLVADLWTHTGPPYKGLYADGFHPNDAGYVQWADALAKPLGLS